jgi:TRAP-type C4-dicarboxylate transport system permease large subunit
MLFGAISGSAAASASAIGSIMTPEMKKEGYDEGFSAAVNITSATTGLTIPPSNILIIFSLASGGASITALFLAGYIPGILTGVGIMIVAMSMLIYKDKGIRSVLRALALILFAVAILIGTGIGLKALHAQASTLTYRLVFFSLLAVVAAFMVRKTIRQWELFKETLRRFIDAVPSLLLLVIVVGGIVAGYFTATEASAVAVLYALVLALIYKEITLKDLPNIILKSVRTGPQRLYCCLSRPASDYPGSCPTKTSLRM